MKRVRSVKSASRKKFSFKRRCVFVLPVQAREVLQENGSGYDGIVSGRLVSYNLRFPGQYWDKETALHYNYFRDYDPSTGRYVQSDPIGFSGGLNSYAYAKDAPLNFNDFEGLRVKASGSAKRLADNKKKGDDYRDELGQFFKQCGCDVEYEVPFDTPFGKRRLDLVVSKNGKILGGIEAKTGGSRYKSCQRSKDEYIKRTKGFPIDLVRKK